MHEELHKYIEEAKKIVIFTGAGFPKLAKELSAKLIIINNQPTGLDPIADLVIHEQIGNVFPD